MPRLYLIRHALPEGDSPRRYLGRADPGLGEAGREQARGLARAQPGTAGLPVWTSPLRRAWETACLAFPGAELRVEPLAAELSLGILDGLLPEEAERLYPEAYAHLQRNPLDAAPCGGESWADLLGRAAALAGALNQRLVGALGEPPPATLAPGSKHQPSGAVLVAHRYLLAALVQVLTGPAATAATGASAAATPTTVRGLDYAECLVLEAIEPPPTLSGSAGPPPTPGLRSWLVPPPERPVSPGAPSP